MSLVAQVYARLPQAGPPWDTHPAVVILEIDGSDECLCIPAFTAGRDTIENAIDSFEKIGISRDSLTMQVNNHLAVQWYGRFEANASVHWAVFNVARLSRKHIRGTRAAGQMRPEYLLRLLNAFLDYCQTPPGRNRFSSHVQKRLRKAAELIKLELGDS